ncbi:MAG: F0F1 ATP synthase subunit B [Chloroflexi bacterium]|nr:F0F1 ATP synthase subunit B [Chloroflexota bacterium]
MEGLGINLPSLIAQAVNFGLLLLLLYLFLYKPVLRMLDERGKRIQESMENAEAVKKELARARQEYEATVAKGRGEAQQIIAQAVEIGEQVKGEARTRAIQEADELLARAKAQIELETQKALVQLRAQVADLAILAASRVIKRSLDREAHHQLIEEALAETNLLRDNGERN